MSNPHQELIELRHRIERLEQALLTLSGAQSINELLPPVHPARPHQAPLEVPAQSAPRQHPTNPAQLASVTKESSSEEKIALFLDYFSGRPDICATTWENKSTGQKGWMPMTKGVSFKKNPSPSNRVPLSPRVIENHLRATNSFHAGLYPMLEDDTTKLLVCDFDDATFAQDATAYAKACTANGLSPLIELSRSGQGAHVWLFFSKPVPAKLARQIGLGLLHAASTNSRPYSAQETSQKLFASFDRFIPAQDLLPSAANGNARLGNLIALPLAGQHRAKNTTVFVTPDFEPFEDQFAALASTAKATPQQLKDLKPKLYADNPELDIPPGPRKSELKRIAKTNAGKQVRVTHGAQVHIPTSDLDSTTIHALTRLGVFPNPQFYIAQARRHSTWNIPRVIVRFTHTDGTLILDRGTLDAAIETLKTAGYSVSRRCTTPKPHTASFTFTGLLFPAQRKAAKAMLAKRTGTLIAPPGAGKTVIALYLVAERSVPTAILVNTKELATQWRTAIEKFLAPTSVGQYGAGKQKPSSNLDIISTQSINRHDSKTDFLRKYGYIIVDECHNVGAPSLASVLSSLDVRFFTGLTATPMRSDGLDPIIPLICGPIRHEMQLERPMTKRYVVHETNFESSITGPIDMTALYNELSADSDRNQLIVDEALAAFNQGESILILVNRRAHIDALTSLIQVTAAKHSPSDAPLILTLHGRQTTQERANTRETLADAGHFILIAMNKVAGEGIDLPALDTLFLASPVSFKGNIIQQVGRITRPQDQSARPATDQNSLPRKSTVHDFYDAKVPALTRMFSKRRAVIRKEGFTEDS